MKQNRRNPKLEKFLKKFNKSAIKSAMIIGACNAKIEESNRRIADMMRQLKKVK